MRWNLRGGLVALIVIAAVATYIALQSLNARREGAESAWSAGRAIRTLREPARGKVGDSAPGLAVARADAVLFQTRPDVLLLDSEARPFLLRSQEEPLPWEPQEAPREPRVESHGWWWDFDLWDYKFPSGDLLLNPEVLDSVRPLE